MYLKSYLIRAKGTLNMAEEGHSYSKEKVFFNGIGVSDAQVVLITNERLGRSDYF